MYHRKSLCKERSKLVSASIKPETEISEIFNTHKASTAHSFLIHLFLLIWATASFDAQITFVDAAHGASGNTFKTGSTQTDETWLSTVDAPKTNNTQWVPRSGPGNGGRVYQSAINNTENFPEITTQISGLQNGTYNIWVFFWDQNAAPGEKWTISAGLTSGDLTSYSSDKGAPGATNAGVVNAATLSFSNKSIKTKMSAASGSNMFGAKLGQVVVTSGIVNVFVDRNVRGNAQLNRVWYDGVGYEPVKSAQPKATIGLPAEAVLLQTDGAWS